MGKNRFRFWKPTLFFGLPSAHAPTNNRLLMALAMVVAFSCHSRVHGDEPREWRESRGEVVKCQVKFEEQFLNVCVATVMQDEKLVIPPYLINTMQYTDKGAEKQEMRGPVIQGIDQTAIDFLYIPVGDGIRSYRLLISNPLGEAKGNEKSIVLTRDKLRWIVYDLPQVNVEKINRTGLRIPSIAKLQKRQISSQQAKSDSALIELALNKHRAWLNEIGKGK
jgi:hypothetical protein